MKRILIYTTLALTFAIALAGTAPAQTLHAIIIADTNDPNIGRWDKQDYVNMTMEVSTIASATGMQLKKYFRSGSQCSKSSLMDILNNLRTGNDDVVLFYYSGHGVRSTQDASEYPQMCMGSRYDSDFVPLEYVLQRLNDQPARLKIVFGDCCNSTAPGVTSKEQPSKGVTVLSKAPVNAYTNLFMNYHGSIIASGSQKGENSLTISYKDGSPAGGTFTVMFLQTLQFAVANGMDADWNKILSLTKETVYAMRKQTPIFEVAATPTETPREPHTPQNNSSTDEAESSGSNDVITLLKAIGNDGCDIEDRIKVMEKALPLLFTDPNVKVETVGRNGTTIVSTQTAKDFMLRLSTTTNLVDLVEVEATRNDKGQYSYLKVHEIYKNY